jgi:hypothetical protein
MEESDDDEKEDNEAEEVDKCTPFACARRRGSCLRNGMGCNQREKGRKGSVKRCLDADRGLDWAIAEPRSSRLQKDEHVKGEG